MSHSKLREWVKGKDMEELFHLFYCSWIKSTIDYMERTTMELAIAKLEEDLYIYQGCSCESLIIVRHLKFNSCR